MMQIGILLSEQQVPQWVSELADQCRKTLSCEIRFIRNNGDPFPKPSLPVLEKMPSGWRPASVADYTHSLEEFMTAVNQEKSFSYLLLLSGEQLHGYPTVPVINVELNDNEFRTVFTNPKDLYCTANGCFTLTLKFSEGQLLQQGRYRCLGYSASKTIQLLHSQLTALFIEGILKHKSQTTSGNTVPALPPRDHNPVTIPGAFAKIHHRINGLFYRYKWNIGIVPAPIQTFLHPEQLPAPNWMHEESGTGFIADPFGYMEEGKTVLLYEGFDENQQRGLLQMAGESTKQLLPELKHHLSYPFLIEVDGERYCIPEQASSGKLIAYKITEGKLQYSHTLLHDFDAVDATLLQHEGKWWIFATRKQNNGADLRLYIFYADDFHGTWSPHPQNPVKTDICTARPAGNFFYKNGKLYRPAQDSSLGYGSGIHIMEVTRLDTEGFSEHIHLRITPPLKGQRYPDGLHTISTCGNQTLVDGKRKVFTLKPLIAFFRKKGINQHPE